MFKRKDGDYPSADFRSEQISDAFDNTEYSYTYDSDVRRIVHNAVYGVLTKSDPI